MLTIKDCTRKDTGEYLLTVSNVAGSKTVALHLTVLDVPGPPTGPLNILEVTPEHMVISWRPPKDDGGSAVMNYIVEKCEGKKETWGIVSSGSTQTKAKVPRLQKGYEYTFRVSAENKMGIGKPLESKPTVAKHVFDPPSPPGKPVVSDITENAVTVSWTIPKSDGGSPISGYIVERRELSGKWIRVNKTPVLDLRFRATGLYEGNTYEFRVFAENIAGLSKPSPISDPIKASRPITPPGPPINPKLKDKSRETADLVWTKPTRDGGSPILGYVVECQKSGSAQWSRINTDDLIKQCAFRVPGLIEGNEYRFRIKAANIVGEGEPRELPESVIAKDILHPPEVDLDLICRDLLTVRVGQTINLTARVKGRPDPDITWSKDGKVVTKDNRTEISQDFPPVGLQIKSATRADHGKYTIVAKNSSGQAQGVVIVNVLDRPGPCQNLKISYVTKDSCMVAWENPQDNGGSEITNYIVEYREPSQRGWYVISSDLTKRLIKASLIENHEYFFRVCAENKVGPGPVIETKTPILAINPVEKPGEPENLHIAEVGKTFVFLKWRRPDYDGGSPNLSYHVERKQKDSDEWERVHKGSIKETSYLIDRCSENQLYQFRVQTKNEGGESNWVKTAEVLVKEELLKPALDLKLIGVLVVKAGETIRIEAGVRGKPQPEIAWAKDKDTTDITKSPRLKVETGLDYTKFILEKSRRSDSGKFVVTATNPAGSFTAHCSVNVLDVPGEVRNLKVSDVSIDRCTLSWDPPEDDGGSEIQNYILEKCESKRMVWSTYSASVILTHAHVTRLIEGNEYIFRVRAENKLGTGPPTETKPIVAKTKYNRPGPPEPPEVTKVSKEEMTVVWNPPEYDGGKSITGYILEKKEKRSMRWVAVTKSSIPERRLKVTNLIPGHEYQFRVKAENEIGLGDPSGPTRPVVAKDPIGNL